MLHNLTHSQKRVLHFINLIFAARGRAPTYTEIMERFSYTSRGHVSRLLHELERKGHITIDFNRKCGIKRCKSPAGSSHSSLPSHSAASGMPS